MALDNFQKTAFLNVPLKTDAHDPCGYWVKNPKPSVRSRIWYSCPQTIGIYEKTALFFATLDEQPVDSIIGQSFNTVTQEHKEFYVESIGALVDEPEIGSWSVGGYTTLVLGRTGTTILVRVFNKEILITKTDIDVSAEGGFLSAEKNSCLMTAEGVIHIIIHGSGFKLWHLLSTDFGASFSKTDITPAIDRGFYGIAIKFDPEGNVWFSVNSYDSNLSKFIVHILKYDGVWHTIFNREYLSLSTFEQIFDIDFFAGKMVFARRVGSNFALGSAVVGVWPSNFQFVDKNIEDLNFKVVGSILFMQSAYKYYNLQSNHIDSLGNLKEVGSVPNILGYWQYIYPMLQEGGGILVTTHYYERAYFIQNGINYGLSMAFQYSKDAGTTWNRVLTRLMDVTTQGIAPGRISPQTGIINPLWPITKN